MKNSQKNNSHAQLQALTESINTHQPEKSFELATALALIGSLPINQLFDLNQQLTAHQLNDKAIALYRLWLEKTDSPIAYAVWFNLAVVLANTQNIVDAEDAYRRALALKPTFLEALLNLATLLERKGEQLEALALWHEATEVADLKVAADKQYYLQALNNQGRLLEIRKQFPEAEEKLTTSLLADPAQPKALTHLIHLRQKQCKWPIYELIDGLSLSDMTNATSALAMLSASSDPEAQLNASRRFVSENVIPAAAETLAPAKGYAHKKLRVGYLSSDLCSHAVSILTAELYELHDRTRFDVYAFSWSREDGTPLRARIVKAMDHYIPIAELSDEQAARCIRSHEIDILVDLHGLTLGTRPNILSWRPAPVQITYLGFPGPTALPCIDYVIADKFVLPPELTPYFTERALYMPNSFQINDRQREIGERPTRTSCGLPEDAFVFCSFNNNFKITEEVFDVWMKILSRVPGSVLWLVSDHDSVRDNLRSHARKQNVDPDRIYFANRVGPKEYLARFQVADLFLDTMPFNAGTTASDALWAGLPILTCAGKTFSSRMAGSLLIAVNLPELITYTLIEYEEKAVYLAEHQDKIMAMKTQLIEHRLSCPLFDTPQFVRDLERTFETIALTTPKEKNTSSTGLPHNIDILNFMSPNLTEVVEVASHRSGLGHAYLALNPDCNYIEIENASEHKQESKLNFTKIRQGKPEQITDAEFKQFQYSQCWIFDGSLERLYDPWYLLKRIRDIAPPGMEIIACIHNAQYWQLQASLNTGNFVYQESGILDKKHIRWLTRATILELFESNGFKIVNMIARIHQQPDAAMITGLRQIAMASGADPEIALQDAIPYQYVVKAVVI